MPNILAIKSYKIEEINYAKNFRFNPTDRVFKKCLYSKDKKYNRILGAYRPANDYICTRGSGFSSYVYNHELVHYNIWHLGWKKKNGLEKKLLKLTNLLPKIKKNINKESLNYNEKYLYDKINKIITITSKNYKKEEMFRKISGMYIGNVEYLAYAINYNIFSQNINNKLVLNKNIKIKNFKNKKLKKAKKLYVDIFNNYLLKN